MEVRRTLEGGGPRTIQEGGCRGGFGQHRRADVEAIKVGRVTGGRPGTIKESGCSGGHGIREGASGEKAQDNTGGRM